MLYTDKTDKLFTYSNDGISKARKEFLMMCSFPEAIEEIYKYSGFVATCRWLADRHRYITTEGMFTDSITTLFKQYKNEKDSPYIVSLDQKIFDITTNWVIYHNFETMVKELEWDKEDK